MLWQHCSPTLRTNAGTIIRKFVYQHWSTTLYQVIHLSITLRHFLEIAGDFSHICQHHRPRVREHRLTSPKRIGHTPLTHSYVMNGEDVPTFVACACDLTVEHILIECGDIAEVRQRYYDAENLQQLFHKISITHVSDFLREIGLFYRM